MKIPGKPRRLELDFVRGIAILLVMFFHFRRPTTGVRVLDTFDWFFAQTGGRGVDLFFVLSGFLVGGLILKEYKKTDAVQPWRFLVRRAFKIWPAYYVLLMFHLLTRRHPSGTFFWQNVFHLQNYLGSSIRQTWSLSIEEHFYFFLALLLAFAAKRHWSAASILKALAGCSVIAIVLRCLTVWAGNLPGAMQWTQNRVDSLFFGVIIALLYNFMPETYARISRRRWPLVLTSLAVVGFVLAVPDGVLLHSIGYTVVYIGCGAFLILVLEHSGRLTNNWLYWVIAQIGVFSYGLYLWHSLVLSVGEAISARLPAVPAWFVAMGAQTAGAMAIAYVTTRLVEWPALYYRESIPWLRDTAPVAARAEDPGPSHEEAAPAEVESKA